MDTILREDLFENEDGNEDEAVLKGLTEEEIQTVSGCNNIARWNSSLPLSLFRTGIGAGCCFAWW